MATPARTAKSAPTAPTAPVESEASKASRTAPIDLSALSVESAPRPTIAAGAGRKAEDNSVAEKWIDDSWSERKDGEKIGGGRKVTVPTAAAGTVVSKLRRAVKTRGLGLSVKVVDNDNGTSVVNFAAKVAKAAPKKAAGEPVVVNPENTSA